MTLPALTTVHHGVAIERRSVQDRTIDDFCQSVLDCTHHGWRVVVGGLVCEEGKAVRAPQKTDPTHPPEVVKTSPAGGAPSRRRRDTPPPIAAREGRHSIRRQSCHRPPPCAG